MTRPLLSRVRKSLFDILGEAVTDGPFLDLYAGSGAVGLEALSRGAPRADFIDKEYACIRIIRENLSRCGFQPRAKVIQEDVLNVLALLLSDEQFYLAFVGPPYYHGLQNRTLEILDCASQQPIVIVVQHSAQEELQTDWEHIRCVRCRSYGDTCLSFFEAREESS